MKCAIEDCPDRADPDGGPVCRPHQVWTAAFMRRCLAAIEAAITSDDGLDGVVGERILREAGHWMPLPAAPQERDK